MSSSGAAVQISDEAYSKVILHATKYFSRPVGGYLIGTIAPQTNAVEIADVLPIFHGNPVGPIFEIAGDLVRDIAPVFSSVDT
jgi:Uncharacterised protein family (UPF0172)